MVMLILMAGIITWFVFYRQYDLDYDITSAFMRENPQVTAYSYLIILLLMCVLTAISWRPFLSIGISFVAAAIITYINMQKYQFRAAPLLPEDFQMVEQAGNLMQFIDPAGVARLAGGSVLIVIGSALLEHCARNVFGRNRAKLAWWDRFALMPRAAFGMAAVAALMVMANPVIHHSSGSSTVFAWLDNATIFDWNPSGAYTDYGFVLAFMYNLGTADSQEPDDYNEETMRQIAEKYQAKKAADEDRVPLGEIADNVIVVLNESFFDPTVLGAEYAYSGGDVTPNLHKIFQKYPSGYMYSPEYGGNTANIEFAVLTSLSNFWARTVPYTTTISKVPGMPGMASYARAAGLDTTTAIHAYDGTMYKRNLVYANMGIETFLDRDTMKHTELENGQGYISDRETYREVLDVLNSTQDPQLIMVATMQNHGVYDSAHYANHRFRLLNDIDNKYMIESAFETIHHSDQYLGEFIQQLDELDERTVVLWFGDHAPGVFDSYAKSGDQELINLTHLTPYFIYANFDLDELYTVKEVAKMNEERGFEFTTRGVTLPVVSPNCLATMMYDVLGAEKPALMYLTADVCKDTPILAPSYYSNEIPDLTPVLRDYELVNYDILSGRRYWLSLGE